ncbi:MAG: hypothetical protein IJW43_04960 [Clostridia bacterium]|nr:hypothetical protein [Clostridia bacterium]
MDFYKKTLVLQKTNTSFGKDVNGIVRLESEDGVTTLSLSLINFPLFEGGYVLVLLVENNSPIILELGKKPVSLLKVFYSLSPFKHFSAGVFCLLDNLSPVAFAKTELGAPLSTLEEIASKELTKVYDDEVIATEDYFSIEREIKDKVDLIDEVANENGENESSKVHTESQKDEKNGTISDNGLSYEEDNFKVQDNKDGDFFYQSAKDELDELFSKFPLDDSLSSVLPDSTFCKIHYASNKYYVVGVIKEKGKVKYICYGVPASYSDTPPDALKDFCCFLPLSLFDLQGQGFWMMFQSAKDGKCIKK